MTIRLIPQLGIQTKESGFLVDEDSNYAVRQAYFQRLVPQGIGFDLEAVLGLMNRIRDRLDVPRVQWSPRFGPPTRAPHMVVRVVGTEEEIYLTDAINATRAAGGHTPWIWRTLPSSQADWDRRSSFQNGIGLQHPFELKIALGCLKVTGGGSYSGTDGVLLEGWDRANNPARRAIRSPQTPLLWVIYGGSFRGGVSVSQDRNRHISTLISEPTPGMSPGLQSTSFPDQTYPDIVGDMGVKIFIRSGEEVVDTGSIEPFEEAYEGSWALYPLGAAPDGGGTLGEIELPEERQTQHRGGNMRERKIKAQRTGSFNSTDEFVPDPYETAEFQYGFASGAGWGYAPGPHAPVEVPAPFVPFENAFEGLGGVTWYQSDTNPLEGLDVASTDPAVMRSNYDTVVNRLGTASAVGGFPTKKYVWAYPSNFNNFLFHKPFPLNYREFVEPLKREYEHDVRAWVGDSLAAGVVERWAIYTMDFQEYITWLAEAWGDGPGTGGATYQWLVWDSALTPNTIFDECVPKYEGYVFP